METIEHKISDAIKELQDNHKQNIVRCPKVFSWGNFDECKEKFVKTFISVDKTLKQFDYLPEYDEVVQWMTNTEGKGLLLRGDKGRGKSTILMSVLPVLFMIKRRIFAPIQAIDIVLMETNGKSLHFPNLERMKKSPFPAIDEFGIEPQVNDFGEKFEGFNQIIDKAELHIKPLFITTNLEPEQLLKRYDSRTLDRLGRLCKTVVFKGNSLR